jgi:hypothetical protein
VFTLFFQGLSKFGEVWGNHGFSAREDNVITVPL